MPRSKKFIKKPSKFYRCLVATALLASSLFQFVAPVLAAGGQEISNTATATYEDSNNPGTTINATSNTVKVTIAEVAGITITSAATVEDKNGGAIEPNDELYFKYTVKNTGNDPTKFHLPDKTKVKIDGAGTVQKLEYSTDNGANWTDISSGGETSSVAADGTILVRASVKVNSNAPAETKIKVTLGNTGNSADTQNQQRNTPGDEDDVYTVDNTLQNSNNTLPAGEIAGDPANGIREASASLEATVKAKTEVLNGPLDKPDAVGPTDNNDDFTNKSSKVPADTKPGTPINPDEVTFTNTVQLNGSSGKDISLLPTPQAGVTDNLPDGTKVTIKYGTDTKEYTWDKTGNQFKINGNPITNKTDYITIPNAKLTNGKADYVVVVDLPDGTKLSTDDDMLKGYPVPIAAFIDDATPGLGTDATTEPRNTTIDRVYTGFLKMVKESKIEKGDGPNVASGEDQFSVAPKNPQKGNYIVYQIKYRNISEPQPANQTGNTILKAKNVVITENGTLSTAAGDGQNNWAKDNNSDGKIDTSNVVGSATAGTQFFKGNTATTSATDQTGTTVDSDVTKYQYSVTEVTPSTDGIFTFKRKVN